MNQLPEPTIRTELERAQTRLLELEATLNAIRSGEVDSIVIDGPHGSRIFSLQSPDEPYRILAERMNEGAASVSPDGTILFCNRRLAEMVGIPTEKLLGSPVTNLAAPLSRGYFEHLLARGLEGESRGELQFNRGDGGLFPVLASLSVISGESADGICLVATDLSQRIVVEQLGSMNCYLEERVRNHTLELETANEKLKEQIAKSEQINQQLEQSRTEQIKLRDQFLSHASHELRSPLAVVHQFVSILLDGLLGQLNPDQREYLEITFRNVNQLRGMIDDLLEASRAVCGKLRVEQSVIDITSVLRQTLQAFRNTATGKDISLVAEVALGLPAAYADSTRICQVLTNLLDNAVKFSPSRSSVTVSARVFDEDPSFLCISVADQGCGIDSAESDRIFDRLYQVKNSLEQSRRGLGLGLYICKELIDQHGGNIWSDKKQQGGCTISFTVPVFSMENLIAPLLRQGPVAGNCFFLVSVKVFLEKNWASARDRATALASIQKVISRCILPDLDVLLPPQNTSHGALYYIVARTRQEGADVIASRVRDQLLRNENHKLADMACNVSAEILHLENVKEDWPLEKQIQSLASCIEKRLQLEKC